MVCTNLLTAWLESHTTCMALDLYMYSTTMVIILAIYWYTFLVDSATASAITTVAPRLVIPSWSTPARSTHLAGSGTSLVPNSLSWNVCVAVFRHHLATSWMLMMACFIVSGHIMVACLQETVWHPTFGPARALVLVPAPSWASPLWYWYLWLLFWYFDPDAIILRRLHD